MALSIRVRDPTKQPSSGPFAEVDKSKPRYWTAQNHSTDNYLRVEKWRDDVKEFMFTPNTDPVEVPLTLDEAKAMLRFREDVKFFAALEDEKRTRPLKVHSNGNKPETDVSTSRGTRIVRFFTRRLSRGAKAPENPMEQDVDSDANTFEDLWDVKAMEDAFFLTRCFGTIRTEIWTSTEPLKEQLALLHAVEGKLQHAIDELKLGGETKSDDGTESGAFVKLSVRSPKDASMCSERLMSLAEERCAQLAKSGRSDQLDAAAIVRWASWQGMKVTTGREALDLLLRSDRVYSDLLQQELFSKDNDRFDISVHVAPFFSGFDPNWEFRGFVADGKKTSLTMYSPFVYEPKITQQKDEILTLIQELWDKLIPRIKSDNYCVDFAVAPDLSKTWVVEVNNFLPPLSGTGLFVFQNALDREILMKGPFEFRVQEQPLEDDASYYRQLHENTRMQYQAAPSHVLEFVNKLMNTARANSPASKA